MRGCWNWQTRRLWKSLGVLGTRTGWTALFTDIPNSAEWAFMPLVYWSYWSESNRHFRAYQARVFPGYTTVALERPPELESGPQGLEGPLLPLTPRSP